MARSEPLREHLRQAYEDRLTWWAQRQRGGWLTEETCLPFRTAYQLPNVPPDVGR